MQQRRQNPYVSLTIIALSLCAVIAHAASSINGKSAAPRKSYKGRVQNRKLVKCKYKVGKGGKGGDIPPPPPTRRVEEGERKTMGIVPNLYYASEVAEKIYYSKEEPAGAIPITYSAPAPAPLEENNWHYEYDGFYDPNEEYEICPEPSAMPSLSSVPSFHPTDRPSPSPSLSTSPSLSPSVSSYPTTVLRAACNAIFEGSVYTGTKDTHRMVKGKYYYEMVTDDGADVQSILASLDAILKERVSPIVVQCGDYLNVSTDIDGVDLSSNALAISPYNARRMLESEKRFWGIEDSEERELQLDGVDLGKNDISVKNDCRPDALVGDGENCNTYEGTYVLYIRESGESMTDIHAISNVSGAISDQMSGVDELSLVGLIDGLEALYFLGDALPSSTTTIGKLTDGRDANVKSSLSATGISLVSVGSLVTLLFLYAATRRRESYKVQRIEEVYEDDESIFGKNGQMAGTDNTSNGSDAWRATRSAHVLGEEDSVFSCDLESDNIMHDLRVAEKRRLYGMGGKTRYSQVGPRENDLGGTGDALNVHNCTSATCQICKNAGPNSPTFVPADLLSPISEVTCETEIVSPRYSSPDTVDIDMAPRPYTSPDTIEM